MTTNFSMWDRVTLEQFARDVANENMHLKADLQTALAAWRNELKEHTNETQPTAVSNP